MARCCWLAFAAVLIGYAEGAAALTMTYSGIFTQCVATCDSFAALGGPGGAENPSPSEVVGAISISVAPGGSFTDADISEFSLLVSNSAANGENAVFDWAGRLINPATANPLPLDDRVVIVSGSGIVGPNGSFGSGELVFTFTQPPFDNNDAIITFDLATGAGVATIFGGIVQFAAIEGEFSPVPLPGAVWLMGSAILACGRVLRRRPNQP